ncbi:MAG: sodium:proton antiporter [Anaerolineales bacterium]|nr:sodium:proton antiporter [Anaerolineales bacterium]MCA9929753.1 sodium:proton antiporter [Anaerolineales bacterium]
MNEQVIAGIGSIVVLGIGAQWIGWRLKLPAILPLLITGFIAGPMTGFLDPDVLIGDLLFPVVSISVAVILFEGGLSLKREDVAGVMTVVQLLISVGVLVTWAGTAVAAYFLFDLDIYLSALLGAILVVSGPTVVLPLLRFIRPVSRVRSILQWEGILVDPVGATLAVLVLGAIIADLSHQLALPAILLGIGLTLLVGGVIGLLAAGAIIIPFQRGWVPEYLHTAVTLLFVIAAFLISNAIRAESGLMATTVMGILLANQKRVDIEHIVSFKEELGVLLLSVLFIVLSARMELADFAGIGWEATLFVAILILVIRPLSVWVSTLRSDLAWRERLFISWLFPRGIVAASVASLFALELHELGYEGADRLLPLTFIVVVGTVTVYALTAGPLARILGLVRANPQGTLIIGAHGWAREMAAVLNAAGFETVLVDTNGSNVRAAQLEGLTAVHGSILADETIDQLPLSRLGRLMALTSNSELNALAGLALREYFGSEHLHMLATKADGLSDVRKQMLQKHCLFHNEKGFRYLEDMFEDGGILKLIPITNRFTFSDFQVQYGSDAVPMFVIDEDELHVIGGETAVSPTTGQKLISLVKLKPEPVLVPVP